MIKAPSPVDKHVGQRVRMRRMMLDWSQERLGDALGVTFQQVQKYEKGTNRISASRLQQISNLLGVPVAFFFEGQAGDDSRAEMRAQHASFGIMVSPSIIADFTTTHDGLSVIKSFSQIKSSKLRRRIVDLIEQIAGDA
jgi:transcriptional regulator with XRE-family HTH domain